MTTGSKVVNNLYVQSLGCGSAQLGAYYSKTWTGSNRSGNPNTWNSEEHPYEMTMYRYFNSGGVITRTNGTTFTGSINSCYGGAIFPDKWTSNDDLALISKLRERVAGSSFNAGVSLAEAPKGLDMIADSAKRIGYALRFVRKGKFENAYQALTGLDRDGKVSVKWKPSEKMAGRLYPKFDKEKFSKENTASNWLQLQYGWLPLLNDAKEGAEFLAQQTLPRKYKVRVRRHVTAPIQGAAYFTKWKGQNTVHGQIVATLVEVNVPALAGLTDPASVAWELVPYSFVVDWFIPIGEYLSARGLAQSLTGTFVTTKFTRGVATFVGFDQSVGLKSFSGASRYERCFVKRTVSTSLAIPLPEVKPLSEVFSWKRAANATALLINANKK